MQSQNLNQINVSGIYFVHMFGMGDQEIFNKESDYQKFLSLIGEIVTADDSIQALAYCLGEDHVDLLISQSDSESITNFVREMVYCYNEYYYEEYGFDDILSEMNYTAELVHGEDLLAVSRELHRDIENWVDCPHSSVRAYLYDDAPNWLNKKKIAEIYGSAVQYYKFLKKK